MHVTDWIIAMSSVVTALGVVFLWHQSRLLQIQARLLHQQVHADHERSRLELAVALGHQWNRSISPAMSAARRLVRQLDVHQSRDLANYKPFRLSIAHCGLLKECLLDNPATEPPNPGGAEIELTQQQVQRLHFLVADYLNETEAALLGWHLGIADPDTMEREFKFLYDDQKAENALLEFRKAAGGAYPAIDSFVKRIKSLKEAEEKEWAAKGPVA